MNRFLLGISLLTAVCCAAPSVIAQSADRIIGEWVKASGGAKAFAKIRSTEWEGIAHEQGDAGDFTLITQTPGHFYREFSFADGRSSEGCGAESCWRDTNSANAYTRFGSDAKRAEATGRYLNFALARYKKAKIRARWIDVENVTGRPADVVELSIPPGEVRRVYFDQSSHLIDKEIIEASRGGDSAQKAATSAPVAQSVPPVSSRNSSAPASNDAEEITFSDYRPVQGVMLPYEMQIKNGSGIVDVAITRVTLNGQINDAVFAFPGVSHRPLPDIAKLLATIDKNQEQVEEEEKDYACMLQQDVISGTGEKRKQTTMISEVSYAHGNEIDRKIEVNGKPLDAAALQKEDEQIKKDIDKYNKETAKPKKSDDNDVQISDFLRISKFTRPRWERFRGRDVVVFDFSPNPAYKPKKLVDKLLHDIGGTLWIDAQAAEIVRLEAHVDNSFHIGGGLIASLQKGSSFAFEQSLVRGQVWLPSYGEAHISAKVLLLKKFNTDVVNRYYDYQKFKVRTTEKIGAPKQR